MTELPTFFLCHGGGPWPYLDGPMRRQFDRLEASLKDVIPSLEEKPKAILVISAHWEARDFCVSTHPRPPMYYDYYGFPEHTYHVRYDAPGGPDIAQHVKALLDEGGLHCDTDDERGFDHGTFTMMEPMRPQADIPVVQMSLRADFDPAVHIAAGRLLAPLRKEGVLIVGSGMTFHNLSAIGPRGREQSTAFDSWMRDNLVGASATARAQALNNWVSAPAARFVHPRPDHIMPLHVAAGAAENGECSVHYHEADFFGAVALTSFRFGRP